MSHGDFRRDETGLSQSLLSATHQSRRGGVPEMSVRTHYRKLGSAVLSLLTHPHPRRSAATISGIPLSNFFCNTFSSLTEKWTPPGASECDSACAGLGLSPVKYSSSGGQIQYVCSIKLSIVDYRPGYKTHGDANCYMYNAAMKTFQCLCNTNGLVWRASTGNFIELGL